MIRLKNVRIHQYKSIETALDMDVENDITVLMGKNEAGKTNILEALAKSNYFNREDQKFHYDPLSDYPRRKKKLLDHQESAPLAVTATYQVSEFLLEQIQEEMVLEAKNSEFSRVTDYRGRHQIIENGFDYDLYEFWETYVSRKEPRLERYRKILASIRTEDAFREFFKREAQVCSTQEKEVLKKIAKFFKNPHGWANPLNEYVYRTYLMPNIPKFMYYDECYMLPSRISLDRLWNETELTPQERTAKAFLTLADIDVDNVIHNECFESYKSELEAAQFRLNDELLKYWSVNSDLRIEFELVREQTETVQPEKKRRFFLFGRKEKTEPQFTTWLEIRIRDVKTMVSLPLENRSKGFNWFFSFWVWFKAIQEYEAVPYILLLDEPGMHLHTSAQRDLVDFMKDLSAKYQIIYTTHSPYMLEELKERVYCVENEEKGTIIHRIDTKEKQYIQKVHIV